MRRVTDRVREGKDCKVVVTLRVTKLRAAIDQLTSDRFSPLTQRC